MTRANYIQANECQRPPPSPNRPGKQACREAVLGLRDGIPLSLEPPGGAEVVKAGGEAQDLGIDVADLGVHVVALGAAVLLGACACHTEAGEDEESSKVALSRRAPAG